MIYSHTDKKVYHLLVSIHQEFKKASRASLVNICKNHELASEFSSFLIELNYLETIRGGNRGPATRIWVGKKPTMGLAVELLDKYNETRKIQRDKLYISTRKTSPKTKPETSVYIQLVKISNQLEAIQNQLSRPQ